MERKIMISLRIDDIGASTKQFEVYSKKFKGLGNLFFLKYLPWFKAWGSYREMIADEWKQVFNVLQEFNAKLTVSITACWVEKDCSLIPFHEKFKEQANVLKKAIQSNTTELTVENMTKGTTFTVTHDLSPDEKEMLLLGGLINRAIHKLS